MPTPSPGRVVWPDPSGVETTAPAAASTPMRERFLPGTLLASRYRIVSRLGQGGMGEVFRADDLVLGQVVALKFLPDSARGNERLLTRFYEEVRITRQIRLCDRSRARPLPEAPVLCRRGSTPAWRAAVARDVLVPPEPVADRT